MAAGSPEGYVRHQQVNKSHSEIIFMRKGVYMACGTRDGVGGRAGQREDLLQVEHIWREDSPTLSAGLHTMYTRQNM